MIRAVLLDIDNTLLSFDGYVSEALREGLPLFGISEYRDGMEQIFHEVNNRLWHQLELGELNYEQLYGQRFNRIFEAMGVTGDGPAFEKYFKNKLRESAVVIDGAREMVEYLSSRYILCAASNGPFDQQKNRLKVCGLLPMFRYLFISEDIGASKPDSAFFERSMERLNADGLNITPDECVMIGDSLTSDMTGGIAFGMHTIFFDLKNKGTTDGMPVDHMVSQLSDVMNIL